jgi:hypothetical protein
MKEKANKKNQTAYLIKRIFITNLLSIFLVVFTYFWIVGILSNANSLWDIFKGKDLYTTKDTIAPITPYLNPLVEATKDDSTTISGKAEPTTKIFLKIDSKEAQDTTSDDEGVFSFTNIPVGYISQRISVVAKDNTGNTSKESHVYTVIKDNTAPEFEITTPKPDEKFKSTGRNYKVTGLTEPNTTVTLNEQIGFVSSNGEFFVNIRLSEGKNELKIKVTDKAGNETEKEVNMFYEKIE